jgi:hypothetical protein
MTWASLLVSLSGPIARQVLISLGLGVATFVGIDAALGALLSEARSAWAGSLSADVAAYVAMSGANVGLSMLAGAMSARLSLIALKQFRVL